MKATCVIKGCFFFILIILLIPQILVQTGCANIVPPSGGPRDSLPPVLVKADPPDSTVNFRGNRIILQFDEYVDLQDVPANLVVSPTPQVNPQIDVRLRTITIRLRDSLEQNTTYTINFGNAIRDYNESNILKDFDYTFSTGPALDSFQIQGKVIIAETGGIDSTLIVMLHRNLEDSAVVNQKPRYVARLDRQGNYTFRNLPSGTFALYALGDAGGSRRYLNKNQFFAFNNFPLTINKSMVAPDLFAYKEADTRTPPAGTRAVVSTDKRLRFTTNLVSNQQSLLSDFIITFEQPLRFLDTNKISLTSDSTFNPLLASLTLDSGSKRLTVRSQWRENTRYNLIMGKDFAEDTLGRRLLKTDTLFFTTRKRTDYGDITIRLRNINAAENSVLQFIQNNAVVFTAPLNNGTYTQQLFQTGEYELRILYDRNKNGKWDPGQFFGNKIQPEIVLPIQRRISIRPNADNDFEIAAPSGSPEGGG
ncbi:MAG: Ig-like domain-containing protein [Chitinophagaceae bacterium]